MTCRPARDFRQMSHSDMTADQSDMARLRSRVSVVSSPSDMMATPRPWATASRTASRPSISMMPAGFRPRRRSSSVSSRRVTEPFLAQDQRPRHEAFERGTDDFAALPRHHGHQPVLAQAADHEAIVGGTVGHDRHVDRKGFQPGQQLGRIAGDQADRDPGECGTETRHPRQDVDGRIGPDGELAFFKGLRPRQQIPRFGLGLEEPFGNGKEAAAHGGQRDTGWPAVEKLHAIAFLELADMVGDRGLCQRQALRRAREPAMDGDRVKGLELSVTHICKTYDLYKNIRFD